MNSHRHGTRLVVPVVRDADTKDIFDLAGEIERLAARQEGPVDSDEVRGSTSRLRMSVPWRASSQPQSQPPDGRYTWGCTRIAKRPVVREGRVEIRDATYLSLTLTPGSDGAYAARFTTRVIETIQDTKNSFRSPLKPFPFKQC